MQEFTRHVFGCIQKVSGKTKKVLFWGTWKEWNGAKTVVANKSDLDDDYGKDCGGGKKLLNIHSGLKKRERGNNGRSFFFNSPGDDDEIWQIMRGKQ